MCSLSIVFVCFCITILHVRDSLVLCLCCWYSQYSTGLWRYITDAVLNRMSAAPPLNCKRRLSTKAWLGSLHLKCLMSGTKVTIFSPSSIFWLLNEACFQVHMLLFVRPLLCWVFFFFSTPSASWSIKKIENMLHEA